ncbi:MAG: CotH kinase family protein [Planctomycetes bacterium]|nr:CotH kinase family protein [Planctomycetota bacterium]
MPWLLSIAISFAGLLAFTPVVAAQDLYDRGTLRTLELSFAQPDWEDQLKNNKLAGLQEYIAGDLTVDGITYANIGVRYKGNSSYWLRQGGQKPPLHIDMKAMGVDQDLYGYHKLILNNQWSDSSLMREVMAYRVLNEFTPSSRANFVKVEINGSNYGIYTNVEHLGGKFTKRWFGNEDGFRYKAVPPDNWQDTINTPPPPGDLALQDISGSVGRARRAYELKNREGDPEAHLDILAAIDVLNNTASADLIDGLSPLFDTDGAIWHLALNNALASLDSYYNSGRNYYLYHDSHHDRISVLPWDYNMAFGGYGNTPNTLSPTKGAGDIERPLLSNLVEGGVLRQQYLAHHAAISELVLDPAILSAEIDALAALIDLEVQNDTRLNLSYFNWQNGLGQLKTYIANRHAFLRSHSLLDVERPEFSAVGNFPRDPDAGAPVTFWADVDNLSDPVEFVTAHYRVRGAFFALELFDDGQHGDGLAGDGRWANQVPGFAFGEPIEYYFSAQVTNSNGMKFEPQRSSFEPLSFRTSWSGSTSDVVLNEFVARNNSGPFDEVGQAEDWIELYNRGASPVDISGMYMTDDLADPTKWEIPAGTILLPGESLHIWADEDLLDGPHHADFKLSTDGEEIALIDVDGATVLDFFVFGPQEVDVATARLHDGEDLWVTTPSTTPFGSNNLLCGSRVYDALDGARTLATMSLIGTPQPGVTVTAEVAGFESGQPFDFRIGLQAVMADDLASGLSLLVAKPIQQARLIADANGMQSIPIAVPPRSSLIGLSVYVQAGVRGTSPVATNALEIVICS